MARTGILYSHVVKAAQKVAAEGRNPTVDSVREALGGTGSKSTIAPLLKRWKAEHQESVVEAELGVPAELLLAVKGVYDKLRGDFSDELALAREAQELALQAAAARLRESESDQRELSRTREALAADLNQTKAELAELRTDQHARAIRLAASDSDNAGLRARLADRASEVGALNTQLTQARAQFEHYQEASAAQRGEERLAADVRASRLGQELTVANQGMLRQQAGMTQQEMRIAQLETEKDQLQELAAAAQAELAIARPEREQLSFRLTESSASNVGLNIRLDETREALTAARMALAAQTQRADTLGDSLGRADSRLDVLEREHLEFIRELATLRAQLAHHTEAPPARPPGKDAG